MSTNKFVAKQVTYTLNLGKFIDNPNLPQSDLELSQSNQDSIKINNVTYNITLQGVKVNRRIYQPDEIEAEIYIVEDTQETIKRVPTNSELKDLFVNRKVVLEVVLKNGGLVYPSNFKIAINYYVHEINPQIIKQSTGGYTMTVKLSIFSMDKLMTLDKYSKVYVAKKLGSGILDQENKSFGFVNNRIETDRDNMRYLKYKQKMVINKQGVEVPVEFPSEFIHPYLVQYNETFYDFMARTANRCGEFLYFEDGKLTLGLPDTKDPYTITDFNTVTGQHYSSSPLEIDKYVRDSMKDDINELGDTNYTSVKKNAANYPNDAFPLKPSYNAELSADEYFFPLYADKFTSVDRESGYSDSGSDVAASLMLMVIKDALSYTTDPVSFATEFAYDKVKLTYQSIDSQKKKNKTGNAKYIDKFASTESGNGQQTVLFSSVSPEGWTTLRYHADVRRYEEEQQRKTICIDMGTSYIPIRLGELIKVGNMEETFVVIQVKEVSNVVWTRNYEEYGKTGSDLYSSRQSQKIFAIPVAETDNNGTKVQKPFPPVLLASPIRKADPQTAFVTDNSDPKYQGRVRIAYPWQEMNMPERKALADAEKTWIDAQKEYEKKSADYEAWMKKYRTWWLDSNLLPEDIAKDKFQEKIDSLVKEYEKNESLNTLYGSFDTTLQTEIKELENLYDLESDETKTHGVKAAEAVNIRANKLIEEIKKELNITTDDDYKDSYDTETQKLEEKEADNSITNDEKVKLENLKFLHKLITLLKNCSASLKEQKNDVKGIIRMYVELLKEEQENYQKKIDHNKIEKDANEKAAQKLKKEKGLIGKKKDKFYNENGSQLFIINVYPYQKAAEEARKKMEAAKAVMKTKAEEFQNKVSMVSSPWIRVVTPMATDGGGTFFKPRVGDEVLVNYDNGNIERPYVMGSLFSKNTLVPDERISRTLGPDLHGNASIAIVSPNGHGITFKDPSDANGFITSVVPALGVIQKFEDIPMDGTYKDISGGIRIGDRYGMYSIDMSSDKRSVKISSSLGTVKLDAFTGITISAPNGDIKIEGKNVSIQAGNKLTLTSGANIKGHVDNDIKKLVQDERNLHSFTSTLSSRLIGEVAQSPVDVGLVRTLLETFLKPIDGTMCIKSKRYLKFEAGLGKAMVQKDRYKADKQDGMATSESFYKNVIDMVTAIDTAFNQFQNDYIQFWKDAMSKKKNASYYLDQYYEGDAISIIQVAAMGVDVDTDHWDDDSFNDNFINDNLTLKDSKNVPIDRFKQRLRNVLNAFGAAVLELHKHISMDKLAHDMDQQANPLNAKKDNAFNQIQAEMEAAYEVQYGEELDRILVQQTPDDVFTKKTFKRKLAQKFLLQVADDAQQNPNIKIDTRWGKADKRTFTNQFYWMRYIQNLDRVPTHPYLKAAFGGVYEAWDSLFDNSGTLQPSILKDKIKNKIEKNYNELKSCQDVWDGSKSGQILFSDDEASTVHIEGNQLIQEQEANSYNLDHLKEVLINL